MTPAQLRAREDGATLQAAPIGILFIVGVLAGLVIGAINCYQLMFNEVSDHAAAICHSEGDGVFR